MVSGSVCPGSAASFPELELICNASLETLGDPAALPAFASLAFGDGHPGAVLLHL